MLILEGPLSLVPEAVLVNTILVILLDEETVIIPPEYSLIAVVPSLNPLLELTVTPLLETLVVLPEPLVPVLVQVSLLTLIVTSAPHAFVVKKERRKNMDKVRNLREEEDFSVGGVFARRALDKEID